MTQIRSRFQVLIVAMLMVLVTACGETMAENPIQGNLASDPDAPVSSDSGQPSVGAGGGGSGVSGHVIDQEGNPIEGAVVVPQSKDSPPQPIPEIAVMTNANGQYQWSLPPGRYTLTVHHDSFTTLTTEPITVAPGKTTGVDITLQKR